MEEYSGEEGAMSLTKRKVTKKYIPPDTQAVKMLLDIEGETDLLKLTDEELEKEKIRLLKLLKEYENENTKN